MVFFNFQVKCRVFCILLRKKRLVARNRNQEGGLIDPRGAEDVKCMGVENLTKGSTPPGLQIPPSTRTLLKSRRRAV